MNSLSVKMVQTQIIAPKYPEFETDIEKLLQEIGFELGETYSKEDHKAASLIAEAYTSPLEVEAFKRSIPRNPSPSEAREKVAESVELRATPEVYHKNKMDGVSYARGNFKYSLDERASAEEKLPEDALLRAISRQPSYRFRNFENGDQKFEFECLENGWAFDQDLSLSQDGTLKVGYFCDDKYFGEDINWRVLDTILDTSEGPDTAQAVEKKIEFEKKKHPLYAFDGKDYGTVRAEFAENLGERLNHVLN